MPNSGESRHLLEQRREVPNLTLSQIAEDSHEKSSSGSNVPNVEDSSGEPSVLFPKDSAISSSGGVDSATGGSQLRHRQQTAAGASTSYLSPKSPTLRSSGGMASSTKYGTLDSSSNTIKRSMLVDTYPRTYFTKKQFCIGSVALVLFLAAVIVTLTLGLPRLEEKRKQYFEARFAASDIEEELQQERSVLVDSSPECADIGNSLLRLHNASVVDAALAALFCASVTSPLQSGGGLNGGFQLLYYSASQKQSFSLNAPSLLVPLNDGQSGAHVANVMVPSLVYAGKLAHDQFGKLNWTQIIEPMVQLQLNGVRVNQQFADALEQNSKFIRADVRLDNLFSLNDSSSSGVSDDPELPLLMENDLFKSSLHLESVQSLNDPYNFYIETFGSKLWADIESVWKTDNQSVALLNETYQLMTERFQIEPVLAKNISLFDENLDMFLDASDMSTGVAVSTFLTTLGQIINTSDSELYFCSDQTKSLKQSTLEFNYVSELLELVRSIVVQVWSHHFVCNNDLTFFLFFRTINNYTICHRHRKSLPSWLKTKS